MHETDAPQIEKKGAFKALAIRTDLHRRLKAEASNQGKKLGAFVEPVLELLLDAEFGVVVRGLVSAREIEAARQLELSI